MKARGKREARRPWSQLLKKRPALKGRNTVCWPCNPTNGSWWFDSDPFYRNVHWPCNPTNGSWWIVHVRSKSIWSIHPLPWVGLRPRWGRCV